MDELVLLPGLDHPPSAQNQPAGQSGWERRRGGCGQRSHLSARSWQVMLSTSATPSSSSCRQPIVMAMKQPVRPIPALERAEDCGSVGEAEERERGCLGPAYLQWTTTGPAPAPPAARRSASTSAISCSSGSVESGVLWSGQDVYQ